MEEELVDDLVVFARGIYTSTSFNKKGPCVYEIRKRCVKLQARHGAGSLPELIVIDGPLQQPLADYVAETGNNETWNMPIMGTQESELRAIPKAARVSFPKLNLADRIEAMELAVSEVNARKQHAQQLIGASPLLPPKPKSRGQSPMQRAASPLLRSFSRERSSFTDAPLMSSRSVSPLRFAVSRTESGGFPKRTQSGGFPPGGFGINRTCSTESLSSMSAANVPVPRFLSSPLADARSLSPLRARSTLGASPGKILRQTSSPMASARGSARSLSPLRMRSASPSLSPAAPGPRKPRGSFGVPQNRYAFSLDMKTPRISSSPPVQQVDAAKMLMGELERKLRIGNYSQQVGSVAAEAAKQPVAAALPQHGSNASSDTMVPPDGHASESFDSEGSSAHSQLVEASDLLQSMKSSDQMQELDRAQRAVSIASSPLAPAGRVPQASASGPNLFAHRVPARMVQVVPGSSNRTQATDMTGRQAGNSQTPAPSQQDRSCMQTPTPPGPWFNRHACKSQQPPQMSAESVFYGSPTKQRPITPLNGRSITPMGSRSGTPMGSRAATPLKGRATTPVNLRSITPTRRSVTPPRLSAGLCSTVKVAATSNLTSALGAFGAPSSPRYTEGVTYAAPVGPPDKALPCTDTFLVVPPPPAASKAAPPAPPTAAAPGAAPRRSLASATSEKQLQGPQPSQGTLPRYASPVVCRRISSRGRSPAPTRSPMVVRRTLSRGQSPMQPLSSVAFNAVAA